jgi:hypothetical protein
MSPEEFREQAREHKNEIRKAWDVASKGFILFERDAIWPDQCDRVHRSILALYEPVQEFRAFLGADSIAILPYEVIPARYTLLRALHRIDRAINDLATQLAAFRAICRSTSSYETVLQKLEIQRKLYDIEQDKETIQFTLDRLSFPVSAEAR